jgi:hypothetical protein
MDTSCFATASAFALVATLVLTTTRAEAGPTLADPAPVATPYPRPHVDRPLLLPPGATEGAVELRMSRAPMGFAPEISIFDTAARARHAWSALELELAATAYAFQLAPEGSPEPLRFTSLSATGRIAVGDEQTVGVAVTLGYPLDEQRSYRPALTYRRRGRLSPTATLEASAEAWFSRRTFGIWTDELVGLVGGIRAETQVTPTVMAEVHGALEHQHILGDQGTVTDDSLRVTMGAGLWLAASRTVDVFVTADLGDRDERGAPVYAVGVVARKLP